MEPTVESAATSATSGPPSLAVWKFASCDGCQLTLLNCEDELLTLADAVTIASFPEATRAVVEGPYDVSLVEGSITTPEDAERIVEIRRMSRRLITIGACATSGGIQALRNWGDVAEFRSVVYAHPEYLQTLETSTAISDHVTVDAELRGCPVDRHQLLEVIAAAIADRHPRIPQYSVCVECKRRGLVCVAVSGGVPCLGPVTQAGCGALCPGFARGCYGCFGPQDSANAPSMATRLAAAGMGSRDLLRVFRTFSAAAEPFRSQSELHERETGADSGTDGSDADGNDSGGSRR
jgi:coenzyme F420-reducing hydrogenase gamma subunit